MLGAALNPGGSLGVDGGGGAAVIMGLQQLTQKDIPVTIVELHLGAVQVILTMATE